MRTKIEEINKYVGGLGIMKVLATLGALIVGITIGVIFPPSAPFVAILVPIWIKYGIWG